VRGDRSLILDTSVGAIFHTALLFSLFLLFAGHNAPGGGFVGGLVAGAALVLRYVAGGAEEVGSVVPLSARFVLGIGLTLALATAAVPTLVGGQLLESAKLEVDLPLLGAVKATSALAFDAGVYLVVVGLVLTVLRTLGQEAEVEVEPAGAAGPAQDGHR
jgi:multicomponent Na+:H+ antiporter subunit A